MCTLFVFPVFFFLLAQKRGVVRAAFDWHTWVFAAVPLLPPLAFYVYGVMHGAFIKEHTSFTFLPHLWRESFYWQGWATMIGRTAGWLPTAVGLIGALAARGRFRPMLLGLWFGYLAYGIIFNYHIHTHDYYQLPLLPIVAMSLAVWVDRLLVRWVERPSAMISVLFTALLLLGVGAMVGKQFIVRQVAPELRARAKQVGALVGFHQKFLLFLGREDRMNRDLLAMYGRVGAAVKHSGKCVVLADDYGKALMYHGEFWGAWWPPAHFRANAEATHRHTMTTTAEFEVLAQKVDADYFVVTLLADWENQTELKAYLTGKYPVAAEEAGKFVIYRLSR
jgi:hypothetical protein